MTAALLIRRLGRFSWQIEWRRMQEEKSSMTTEEERPAQLAAVICSSKTGGRHTRMRWEREYVKPQWHASTTRNHVSSLKEKADRQRQKDRRQNLGGQTIWHDIDPHDIGLDERFLSNTPTDMWSTKNKCEQHWAGVKCHAAEMNGKRGLPKWKTSQQQVLD